MSEIWKDIFGYEGLYQISSFGRVKSLSRITPRNIKLKEKILNLYIDKNGYCTNTLSKSGLSKTKKIHRLVAESFISNPLNLPQVNHIDGNKINNYIDNLEWVNNSGNQIHAYKNGLQPSKAKNKNGRYKGDIEATSKDGTIVKTFQGAYELEKYGFCSRAVYNCLSGRIKSHKGYFFKRVAL